MFQPLFLFFCLQFDTVHNWPYIWVTSPNRLWSSFVLFRRNFSYPFVFFLFGETRHHYQLPSVQVGKHGDGEASCKLVVLIWCFRFYGPTVPRSLRHFPTFKRTTDRQNHWVCVCAWCNASVGEAVGHITPCPNRGIDIVVPFFAFSLLLLAFWDAVFRAVRNVDFHTIPNGTEMVLPKQQHQLAERENRDYGYPSTWVFLRWSWVLPLLWIVDTFFSTIALAQLKHSQEYFPRPWQLESSTICEFRKLTVDGKSLSKRACTFPVVTGAWLLCFMLMYPFFFLRLVSATLFRYLDSPKTTKQKKGTDCCVACFLTSHLLRCVILTRFFFLRLTLTGWPFTCSCCRIRGKGVSGFWFHSPTTRLSEVNLCAKQCANRLLHGARLKFLTWWIKKEAHYCAVFFSLPFAFLAWYAVCLCCAR